MNSSRATYAVRVAGLVCVYFAAGKLGLSLAFEHGSVSPVWPPAGVALAALLTLGVRYWPGVAVGAFLINVVTPTPHAFLAACAISAGNTLEAVIGAVLLTRVVGFRPTMVRLRDVLGLIFLAAGVSTLVSATVGVATLCANDPALWARADRLWWQWWVGDAMGDLVVAPVLLLWSAEPRLGVIRRRGGEAGALLVGLLGTGWLVFCRPFSAGLLDNAYWIFPFLIWAALRFPPRALVMAVVLVSALAIEGTLHGFGPFVRDSTDASRSLVLLQMFLGIATIKALILAAVLAERDGANRSLLRLNEELEQRVTDRTEELARTNEELARKNEENETFVYSVSHDLRSPLVNLQGFSEELIRGSGELREAVDDAAVPSPVRSRVRRLLDGEMAESLRFIGMGVARLSGIIDALLRLSRVGRVEYRFQDVDLGPVLARILAALHGTIEERGASVSVADLPSAWADPTAAEQIFANLVGNALNYLDALRPGVVEVGVLPRRSATLPVEPTS